MDSTERKVKMGRPRKYPEEWERYYLFMPKWYYDIVKEELEGIREDHIAGKEKDGVISLMRLKKDCAD